MFRNLAMIVSIAFLFLLFSGVAKASPPQQKFKIYLNNSECLSISGAGNRKGALLVIERCAVKASQVFEIYAATGPGVRQNIKTAAGFCIDIPGGNKNDGSVIQQWDCDKSAEQAFQLPVWTRANQPVNVGRILAPHSGKCFDASVRPGIRQNPCNGSASQRFYVVEIPAAPVTPTVSVPISTVPTPITTVVNSPNAAFLNSEVRTDRAQMPFMYNALQMVGVESWCPVGCDRKGNGDALVYRAKTNLLASSAAFNREVALIRDDYCTRPSTAAKPSLRSKNISLWVTFLDRFNNQIAQKLFTPGGCAAVTFTGAGTPPPATVPPVSPTGSSVEDQYWDAVKNSVNPADFRAYLNNYPTGKYVAIARLKISQLTGSSVSAPAGSGPVPAGGSTVEDQYWDAVKSSVNPRDFQAYLNSYPNGKYAPIARLKIRQLGGTVAGGGNITSPPPVSTGSTVEQQYWDAIKNSSNAQDFQNYLRDYPNGQFVPIARLKISQFSSSPGSVPSTGTTVEDQYWNSIFSSRRAQDFQGYLYNYPNGKYSAIARLRIGQLGRTAQNVGVGSTPEDQYWNNVSNSSRAQDFQSYLNLYPNGKYSAVARLRISQLGGSVSGPSSPVPNERALESLLGRAQFGSLNELLGLTRFWIITEPGDLDSKRKITKKLKKEFKQLTAASSEQDADFFIIFKLTDNAGAPVNSNTVYVSQTIKGTLKAFTAKPGPNGTWNLRILYDVSRYRSWDAAGNLTNLFSKAPADAAAGRFAKDLEKIDF